MSTQTKLAAHFLELHSSEKPLLIPNPWDVGSAKILEHIGFKSLATTSSGLAATMGSLDYSVSRHDALAHCRLVAAAATVPVSADLENGYVGAPNEVAETYRLAWDAGLVGASLEDLDPESGDLYEIGFAAERVAAAAEAAHGQDRNLVLTGRAETYHVGRKDLDETIARLQAYQEAGADVLYAPFLSDLGGIRSVVESVDRPVNVLLRPDGPTVAELASVGVARVSVGGSFAYAALGALVRAGRSLLAEGTYSWTDLSQLGAEGVKAAFGPRS